MILSVKSAIRHTQNFQTAVGIVHEITDLSKMYPVDSSDEEHDSSGDGRDYRPPDAHGDSQVDVHDTDLTTVLRPLGSSSRKAA